MQIAEDNHRMTLMRLTIAILALFYVSSASAQDAVIFRNKGESGQQTTKGKIEGESLAGIKIAGKTIPTNEIVDVQYEIPGSIKLDLPKAVQAEAAGKSEEAIREYRALLGVPAVINNKKLKRHFEFKIAWLSAGRSDNGPDGLRDAMDALGKFITANPDSWQRVIVSRLLARLQLDLTPPNYDAARKVLEELAQNANAPTDVKNECAFGVVDLWLRQTKLDEARKALTAVPSSDPRTAIYQIVASADPTKIDNAIKKLELQRDQSDNSLKPVIYNALGDCYRLDPKRKNDALFAYLWVDVVYNFDPVETTKAQDRLAELFAARKDEDRAKLYRNKARGR